jgi:hypothetical protein
MADHQPVRSAAEAAVGNQRDRVAQSLADEGPRDAQHLLHPGPPDRSFVPDDDDVAGHDLAGRDGRVGRRLRVEHACPPAVVPALVARQLHHAAVRGERPTKDRQSADRLERPLQGNDDLLTRRLHRGRSDLGKRPAVDIGRVAVNEIALEQLARDESDATRLVHVGRGEPAARHHVRDDRGPVGYLTELVEGQRDAVFLGDREEVQDAVRGAAGGCH